jgi:hypothetical protein
MYLVWFGQSDLAHLILELEPSKNIGCEILYITKQNKIQIEKCKLISYWQSYTRSGMIHYSSTTPKDSIITRIWNLPYSLISTYKFPAFLKHGSLLNLPFACSALSDTYGWSSLCKVSVLTKYNPKQIIWQLEAGRGAGMGWQGNKCRSVWLGLLLGLQCSLPTCYYWPSCARSTPSKYIQ